MKDDVMNFLRQKKVRFSLTNNFESVIPKADAIYCTRIQDEHDEDDESKKVDYTKYYFKKEHLKLMKKDAILMHPFPRRMEIEVAVDNDPRAKYWEQARNGMWVRAALILKLMGRENLVLKR